MQRFFVQLAYDGTNYHGWQVQKNAHTVQAKVNAALSTALQEKTETLGCGRTDTGVHAKEFFAHFDCCENFNFQDLMHKLNCLLPKDIAVYSVFRVSSETNARFDAISRTYEYHIHQHKNPFLLNKSLLYFGKMDLKKMNEAARILLDYEDFSAFSKSRTQVKTNICKISRAKWEIARSDQFVFQITADRFLRGMVRAIVGTMIDISEGKISIEQFKKIIESKDRKKAGENVPACGLYLTHVKYHKEIVIRQQVANNQQPVWQQ
ncbi:MAG: tRNA pseudouridine(38-40) synthase TruA [Flavobacteriales bacterium]|nr:MAG: tRNA pseudouridine(38-40) synthase TruA [Flavobacteriales bacterium]